MPLLLLLRLLCAVNSSSLSIVGLEDKQDICHAVHSLAGPQSSNQPVRPELELFGLNSIAFSPVPRWRQFV